ncbi:MAG TPA: helix-turn-helix transcriptional regulator [Opitutaceae bacterium]|nr:helix-turn-helix transcriptional regulator [Opitutaceae bacterium]
MIALLAERCRQLRLAGNETQESLAQRAGVGPATLQRFERTGRINTAGLARIVFALGRDQDFAQVLVPRAAMLNTTLDQLERQQAALQRRRARRPRPHAS